MSSEVEIKKIYEKSIRLLNDKQARLMDLQQVLKKSVIRLSLTARKDDDRVNNILNDIKSSVDDHVDIDLLNQNLDELFVLTNNSGYQNSSNSEPFYSILKKDIKRYIHTPYSKDFISKFKILVNKEASNTDISSQLIDFIDEVSRNKQHEEEDLNLFIKTITKGNNFSFSVTNSHTTKVLHDLAIKVSEYIHKIQSHDGGVSNATDDKILDSSKNAIIINHVLNEIVNQLTLPSVSKKEQFEVRQLLNKSEDNNESLNEITTKIVVLINQSIHSYELEKKELEEFITKICAQLSDIEKFTHLIRNDSDGVHARSLALTDSIETDVADIEDTVTKSSDLDELKKHVSTNLKEIRKHVEDYKIIDKQQADITSQRYTEALEELSRAQDESAKLKEQLHESKTLLLRDPLTGIANRLAYNERVTAEVNRWQRSKSPLSIAIWDIDHFKKINDTYGHSVGDRVLMLFSDIIQKRIRKVDFFARIGGEEFVLLMPDTTLTDALTVNNKLRVLLEECNFHYEGKYCNITSSVGIAEFREGDDEDIALKNADKALYQSKNNGRNRCTIYEHSGENDKNKL